MKTTSLFLLLLFTCNCAFAFQSQPAAGKPGKPLNFERVEEVTDSLAISLLRNSILTGMSVAVAHRGDILFSKGYGFSNFELKEEATPKTVYKIASITKQFTAAIILRLIEEGKIKLNDTLGQFLPEYPAHGAGITVQQLLNQTSGIGSEKYDTEEEIRSAKRNTFYELSDEEMLAMFANAPLEFAPGEKFAYRNQNYILLGKIIEKVTGIPYEEYVEVGFLKPLGFNHTSYCDEGEIITNRAQGYTLNKGEFNNAPYMNMKNPGAAGGLCSTVEDLIRWNVLLHSGQIISPESLKLMTSSGVLNSGDSTEYGFGLKVGSLENIEKIFHGGSISGFNSILEFYPEEELTIVVMTNTVSGQDEKISEAIARAVFGLELRTRAINANERKQYEGSYSINMSEKILNLKFFSKNDQLYVDFAGEGISPLLYQGENRFVAALDPNLVFQFHKNNDNDPDISVSMGGKTYTGNENN